MRISEKGDQLILRKPIGCGSLLFGGIFIIVSLSILNVSSPENFLLSLLLALPVAGLGLLVITNGLYTDSYIFDRRKRVLHIEQKAFLGNPKVTKHAFRDLKKIEVDSETDSEWGAVYFISIVPKEGEAIAKIRSFNTKRQAQKVVDRIVDFLSTGSQGKPK